MIASQINLVEAETISEWVFLGGMFTTMRLSVLLGGYGTVGRGVAHSIKGLDLRPTTNQTITAFILFVLQVVAFYEKSSTWNMCSGLCDNDERVCSWLWLVTCRVGQAFAAIQRAGYVSTLMLAQALCSKIANKLRDVTKALAVDDYSNAERKYGVFVEQLSIVREGTETALGPYIFISILVFSIDIVKSVHKLRIKQSVHDMIAESLDFSTAAVTLLLLLQPILAVPRLHARLENEVAQLLAHNKISQSRGLPMALTLMKGRVGFKVIGKVVNFALLLKYISYTAIGFTVFDESRKRLIKWID